MHCHRNVFPSGTRIDTSVHDRFAGMIAANRRALRFFAARGFQTTWL
jgi:hypothetical protein